MLPQLSPSLQFEIDTGTVSLEQTIMPAFVILHRHLSGHILDHDGSTRSQTQAHEATGVVQKLRERHEHLAKCAILTRALQDICTFDSAELKLSGEMKELCYLVSAYLSAAQAVMSSGDSEIEDLMAGELLNFRTNLSTIAELLSIYLKNLEAIIVAMLEPLVSSMSDSPSQPQPIKHHTSRIPSSLTATSNRSYRLTTATTMSTATATSTSASALVQTCQHKQLLIETTALPNLLASISTTLSDLLTLQTDLLASQIRHAELHTHSSLARHLTSHAIFLSTVSRGLSLKAQILALQREKEAYAAEGVRDTLYRKFESAVAAEKATAERERALRGLLKEYHDAAEGVDGVFEKLGRGYREVEEEIDLVKKDVERLEREVEKGDRGKEKSRV